MHDIERLTLALVVAAAAERMAGSWRRHSASFTSSYPARRPTTDCRNSPANAAVAEPDSCRAGRESRRISLGPGLCPVGDALVRDRRLGVWRVCRVLLDAADEIERGVQRLVVLRIRRDIGLRPGLLVAFGLKVSAQRSLAARVGACLELLGHVLQHLDVGRNTLGLDGASGRGEVARGCQPQRPIAGAE